jgi:hypothetical protein
LVTLLTFGAGALALRVRRHIRRTSSRRAAAIERTIPEPTVTWR